MGQEIGNWTIKNSNNLTSKSSHEWIESWYQELNYTGTRLHCRKSWRLFWMSIYWEIYCLIGIACVLGVVTNILNVVIFTRKKMRNPVNMILIALAVSDFLYCISKFLQLVLVYYQTYGAWISTDSWPLHEFVLHNTSLFFHTLAINMTILVAAWRFYGIVQPLKSRRVCTSKNCKIAILFCTLLCIAVSLPLIIAATSLNYNGMYPIHFLGSKYEHLRNEPPGIRYMLQLEWLKVDHVVRGIFTKVGPCVLLTILTIGLIISILKSGRERQKLTKSVEIERPEIERRDSETPMPSLDSQIADVLNKKRKSKAQNELAPQFSRTTRMLVVILVVFLCTEFPEGIAFLVVALYSSDYQDIKDYYAQCMDPLLPLFVLLSVVSSTAGFFIYFVMSDKFRSVCRLTFFPPSPQISRSLSTFSTDSTAN